MISGVTGEVVLAEGVLFTPHCGFLQEHMAHLRAHIELPIAGWSRHMLGEHESDHGSFELQVVTDPACRIQTVLLSHLHPFYRKETLEDAERRAFHEGVIEGDLGGIREFSWGEVFCKLDPECNQDWLVVVYKPGPSVPLRPPVPPHHLRAHAPLPASFPNDELFVCPPPHHETRGTPPHNARASLHAALRR